jgi:hypothetical protein
MSDSKPPFPMTEQEIASFAAHWVQYWKASEDSEIRDSLFWINEKEWDLVKSFPFQAWRLVLAILELDSSPAIQEVLSAGPLENLLAKHGEVLIEVVEERARTSAVFASLLGGVWQNSMSDAIWSRVQSVWNRSGWDGNP